MQGDTGGYGGASQAPTRVVPIYNVWNADLDVDEWHYDPNDAITTLAVARKECTGPVYVTRYKEIDGNVNTQNDYVPLTDEELEDDARDYVAPLEV